MKFVFLLAATLVLTATASYASRKQVQTEYLHGIKEGSILGLDVRSSEELEQNPAKGALHIPISELKDRTAELDKDRRILVFCESGGRASKAKDILEERGFKKVENIGDWRAWNKIMDRDK